MRNLNLLFSIVLLSSVSFAGVFLQKLPQSDKIFRGRAPKPNEINQMKKKGITSVLIFKNQTKDEVDAEIKQLKKSGFNPNKIHHVPFQWKDFKSEKLACEQTIEALKILAEVQKSENDKILFHCTVGEDRTGLLAGLMTQLLTESTSTDAYMNEMCLKGYSGGNTAKPIDVQKSVDKYLTPLYFKISEQIQTGRLTIDNLNKNICKELSSTESHLQPCAELISEN